MSLEQNFTPPLLVEDPTAKTSVKPFAQDFNDLTNFTLHQPTKAKFDEVFGPLLLDDTNRIQQQQAAAQAPQKAELVKNEADVVRWFHRDFSGAVVRYFTSMPLVYELDQSGPLGPTQFRGFVDTQLIHGPTQQLLAIGEHKTPGVIGRDWSPGARQTTKLRMLGQELRAYAYYYKCPQIFCWDGVTMLVIRFRADNPDMILGCNGDMFLIPSIAGPGGIYPRYALYRLMVDGLHRLMAAAAPRVTISPYTRHFDWFNGNPYWTVAGSNIKYPSVNGLVRTHRQHQTGKWQLAWMNQGVFASWCSDFF